MSDSVFTRIIRREIPAAIVYEDEQVIAFMDAGQVNPGHVLVATRRQVETFVELDEAEAAHLFAVAHRVACAVQAAFAPEGMTLLQTNRPAGWQTVPHVHVHVLPRHTGDGADLVWPRKDPPLAELQALAARIRLDCTRPPDGVTPPGQAPTLPPMPRRSRPQPPCRAPSPTVPSPHARFNAAGGGAIAAHS
jgi:histidine triad (HIT) family protein